MQQTAAKKTSQKKQAAPAAAPAAAAPVEKQSRKKKVQNPEVQPTEAEVQPTEAQNVEAEKKALTTSNNGIHISRARCEWYMRNLISDDAIEAKIKELKDGLKSLTVEDEIKAAKNEINELNKKLFRISHYAPTAVSIICDTMVKDLIRFGINQVVQSGKKTLDILHFQTDELKSLRYYSLISNSSILASIESLKQKKPEPAEPAAEAAAEPADTMTFNTYIVNAINEIKKERDNSTKIIVGTRVKKFLSDLIIELIKRVMVITRALLKSIVNVRTIVPEHVKAIVNILLVDGNASTNDIDDLMRFIDLKMEEAKVNQKNEVVVEPAAEPVV